MFLSDLVGEEGGEELSVVERRCFYPRLTIPCGLAKFAAMNKRQII